MSESPNKRLYKLRQQCLKLLAETDHKMLPDYCPNESKEPWINYRASLRMIINGNDPDVIIPVKPIVGE